MAAGGAGIGNLADGRIIFVDDSVPGDVVEVVVRREKRRHVEARTVAVIEPGPTRRAAPCPHAPACGGCDWQHIDPDGAGSLRRDIVADSLRRIGRFVGDIDIRRGQSLPAEDYRTILRAAVADGRAGFRAERSHEAVTLDRCLVAHPLAEELLVDGRFGAASEVIIKVGARTGERLVVLEGVTNLRGVSVPDDVQVMTRSDLEAAALASRPAPHIHEEVGGHRFQISADSFFQCRPDGAELLTVLVADALAGAPTDGLLVDAYGGVGLFGALVAGERRVVSIEVNPSSTADAVVNLPDDATVVNATVEDWSQNLRSPSEPVSAIVADPARKGLGAAGVEALAATMASHLALVSCDPASLGRDARLLVDAGYRLEHVTTVDLFAMTSHVEAVSLFVRDA